MIATARGLHQELRQAGKSQDPPEESHRREALQLQIPPDIGLQQSILQLLRPGQTRADSQGPGN